MPTIHLAIKISAPIQEVFDAARSIDLHQDSMSESNERAVAGRMHGLIEIGESVTWEARHFGIKQNLTSKITEMVIPESFTDEMVSGAFHSFKHTHTFIEKDGITIMMDKFIYKAPLGIIGRLADIIFLKQYVTKLITKRNLHIQDYLESANR